MCGFLTAVGLTNGGLPRSAIAICGIQRCTCTLYIAAASTISTSMSTTTNAAAAADTTSASTLLPDTPLSPKSDVRRALLRLKTDSPIKTGGSAYVKIPLPRSAGIVKKDQLRVRLKVLQSVENMMTGSPGGSTRVVGTPSAPTPAAAQLLEQLLSTKGAIVLGPGLTPEAGLGSAASFDAEAARRERVSGNWCKENAPK